MSILERDALKNWCPFTRAAWAKPEETRGWQTTGSPVGFNRALIRPGSDEESVGRCIGSGCMAWRTTGSRVVRSEIEMVGLTGTRKRSNIERVGCCGLAGPAGISDEELCASPEDPSA